MLRKKKGKKTLFGVEAYKKASIHCHLSVGLPACKQSFVRYKKLRSLFQMHLSLKENILLWYCTLNVSHYEKTVHLQKLIIAIVVIDIQLT